MTANAYTPAGYAAAAPMRTPRGAEYAIFAQVTGRLKAAETAGTADYPKFAQAILDNQTLWLTLAEDLAADTNELPVPLRAQLISLAEFVRKHSMAILSKNAEIAPLIDINTAIMKGLRGEVEAAA